MAMTAIELMVYVRSLGVKLWIKDNQLCYQSPKGILTPIIRKELASHKEEIIAFLLANTPDVSSILKVSHDKVLPLTFGQERLWFLDQLNPQNPAYNITRVNRFIGSLVIDVLRQSVAEIVRRHEILRTTFASQDGQPHLIISPNMSGTYFSVDLSNLPTTERESAILRIVNEEVQRPFDLACGPLLRVTLLHITDTDHVLIVCMHHIISDGWSMAIFNRELVHFYTTFVQGLSSSFPELSLQYADFAYWQRQSYTGATLQRQLDYWVQHLTGAPTVLDLPVDRPRPPIQSSRGAGLDFAFPDALSIALHSLGREEGATLFMTLLTAFAILLARYSGQYDILIGSPIAGRTRSDIEGLIGLFVNTLVLRIDMVGNLSFRQLLKQVRRTALDAYAHQDLPFEKLVEELHPDRDLSRAPLIQVLFALHNIPFTTLDFPGVTTTRLHINNETAKFDLTLTIFETDKGLQGNFEYNTDLFEPTTIARMSDHFHTLLNSIVNSPDQSIDILPIVPDAERNQLIVAWNATQQSYPHHQCIHQLFEAQADRTPEAIAAVFGDEQLTYRELNRRANQLACYLYKLGVGPDVLVGIFVERSLEMIIGILGILKAGGAYLPLDPAFPKDRLAWMLNDSQPIVLVTQESLEVQLPSYSAQLVYLNKIDMEISQEWSFLDNRMTSDNLAYLLYTSGSTGKPKGIQVPHRSVVNLLLSMQQQLEIGTEDILLSVTTLSFDIAALELFLPLIVGARMVIASRTETINADLLANAIEHHSATMLQATPATWQLLLAGGWRGKQDLRMLCGGEMLSRELARLLLSCGATLWNMYGPTETTIWSTITPVADNDGPVPIGHPIANTYIYILDAYLQPVPIGVPGEIYIGGAGVTRGYLNHPELTAERFAPNPFTTEPGARLYKTNDLARYRSNGELIFLGRTDHQVKIRGFRIELNEIEAVLRQYPPLHDAAVIAREDMSDHKQLVAYVVPSYDTKVSLGELRRFLQLKLPDYMIPSFFVTLDRLPVSPNGKIDRRALPSLKNQEIEGSFTAARNSIEGILLDVWVKVLGIPNIGIHDNFFELGGDSLLSIQLISRCNQSGLQLSLKQLFQHQTIAELAAVVNAISSVEREQELVTGSVPLIPNQYWFFEWVQFDPHHWNLATLREVNIVLDPVLMEKAIQQVLRHHDTLRIRFTRNGSAWQQFNKAPDAITPFTYIDFSALPEEEQRDAIEKASTELQTTLSLSEGPLIRVVLFELGAQRPQRVLIVVHHLVADAFSLTIIMDDLQTAYQQLSRSEEAYLPLKTTSFKQWAEQLIRYSRSAELQQELDYWLTLPWNKVVGVPVDFAGGQNAITEASMDKILLSLSVEETQILLQKVLKRYDVGIIVVFLTTLAQAFARWSGTSTLLVEVVGHGREAVFDDIDLSRTVGWFAHNPPMLLELGNMATPEAALNDVKAQVGRIPKGGVGYNVLRYINKEPRILQTMNDLPRQRPEVYFNYAGQFSDTLPESAIFRQAQENPGPFWNEQIIFRTPVDCRCAIFRNQLYLTWTYSKNLYRRTTVESLSLEYMEVLRSIITSVL